MLRRGHEAKDNTTQASRRPTASGSSHPHSYRSRVFTPNDHIMLHSWRYICYLMPIVVELGCCCFGIVFHERCTTALTLLSSNSSQQFECWRLPYDY